MLFCQLDISVIYNPNIIRQYNCFRAKIDWLSSSLSTPDVMGGIQIYCVHPADLTDKTLLTQKNMDDSFHCMLRNTLTHHF